MIPFEHFKEIVWPLPVGDLLYVGRSTARQLELIAINTIGDLARTDVAILRRRLGKWGEILWFFANGMDTSPVRKISESEQIKSIGNGTTCPRDLQTEQDVRLVFTVLAESVAAYLAAETNGISLLHVRADSGNGHGAVPAALPVA